MVDSRDTANLEKVNHESNENDLSSNGILEELGGFGLHHIIIGFSIGAAMLLTFTDMFDFVFAADIPDHRCWIPECEPPDSNLFYADWIKYAIPSENGVLDSCSRFAYISSAADGPCSEQNFNQSQRISCDGFITKNQEDRVVSALNLFCTDREKGIPFIGTASTVGRFVGMFVSGFASDKLGRLNTIIGSLVLGAIFGSLQALPTPFMSFELYVALEFLESFTISGTLGTCYVYNMEWVAAKHRAHLNGISTIIGGSHPLFIGLAAWYFEWHFVAFKLVLAVPGFLIVLFYFVLSETPQWLLARQKYARLIKCIRYAGKINGRAPSQKLVEQIESESINAKEMVEFSHDQEHRQQATIRDVVKEKLLAFRLVALSLVWLFVMFAYYGIMLNSTQVHDNKYVSYTIIGLAEIPGSMIAALIIDRLGRRVAIGASLLGCGVLLLASTQLTADLGLIQLILFFISRAFLEVAEVGIYTYTPELWPTTVRSTASNICSISGRFGAILASVSVMLVEYHAQLPVLLYAAGVIVGAVLLFVFLPETAHCDKLPDTVDDALAIGRKCQRSHK